MNVIRKISYALVITGAIVLGIIGFFDYNIVTSMFGDGTVLSRILFSLVGIGAVLMLTIPEQNECYCENMDTSFH